jgi:hypothetical protein
LATRSEAEKKEYISNHLLYDWVMVQSTWGALHEDRGQGREAEQNALLESFAIRTRVLMEFFFDKEPKALGARAFQFCEEGSWMPVKPKALQVINWRVNSEIVHASYARLNLNDDTRQWRANDILFALQELVQEFSRLCKPEYLDDTTRKVLLDQRGAFPGTPLRDVDMSQITVIDPNLAAISGVIIPRAEE